MLNNYLTDNYDKLKDIAYNITNGKDDDDLLSFVIEELYKCEVDRISEIIKYVKIKPTFFNTRKERLYWDYYDTNNYLFTILFDSGAELSFILRDLKKNENILNYIYKKVDKRFDNVIELEASKISSVEYNLMKQINIPSIVKIC